MPDKKTARLTAAEALGQFSPCRGQSRPLPDKIFAHTTERQRVTDLFCNTIRNLKAIDIVIEKFTGRKVSRIQKKILNIIRIAVSELVYSPLTPQHALVSQAVENAKSAGGKKQTAFVNAALREITRNTVNRQAELTESNWPRILPGSLLRGCEFASDIFLCSGNADTEYLADAFSLPKWLIETWMVQFGPVEARQICFASNRHPGIYLRPNALKTTPEKLSSILKQAEIEHSLIIENSMIRLKKPGFIGDLAGFSDGLFTVQGQAACVPVRMLGPKPGEKILDLCSAPGTKTTQLAELSQDKARIFATDISDVRLKMVDQNLQRLGIESVTVFQYDRLDEIIEKYGPFDAVLLDVPCSNSAVLAKRLEVRFRITAKAVEKLSLIQTGLLERAAECLKPKGRICYSTCSIQSQENRDIIGKFILKRPFFELTAQAITLPCPQYPDSDGGYCAVISQA